MIDGTQLKFEDVSPEYNAFVDKFKPKKTTDDCYTPNNIYTAVLDWVVEEYEIDPCNVVRPFWPGGDYERHEYPDNCTVVDNPPFSIISKICRRYQETGIKFFLFAPHLTNFTADIDSVTHVICAATITYENGASVNTSFLTNLEPDIKIRTAPDLLQRIELEEEKNKGKKHTILPKYIYPPEVVTVSMVGRMAKLGIDFKIRPESCRHIKELSSQKQIGKTIFGAGFLISEKSAREKEEAEKVCEKIERQRIYSWELSDAEKSIIQNLV